MKILYERCCGIDVHKKMVVVCLLLLDAQGRQTKEIRTYRTVMAELLRLRDWLVAQGCQQVAMEATGVYWKPIMNVLEGHIGVLVVNAQHIKAVPGRKTDVRDAEWIAELLQHGLLSGSFIPPRDQREVRELTRFRVSLVQERARAVNRLQKTLEETNIKLGDVATDILGKSARAMLEGLLAGQSDPEVLAGLARGRLKAKRAELQEALVGTMQAHHRFLLQEHLGHIDRLDQAIGRVTREIGVRLTPEPPPALPPETDHSAGQGAPEADGSSGQGVPEAENSCRQADLPTDGSSVQAPPEADESSVQASPTALTWDLAIVLLCSIPGISRRAAEAILAEIGRDMTRFPSAHHLASWAGMCPGNHESAGKRLSGRTRKGSPWLRLILVEVAHAAAHSKHTALSAQYHRIAARRGAKRATIALGHSILVIIYHVLQEQTPYRELANPDLTDEQRQALQKRLLRRLEKLGYHVEVQPPSQVA